MSYSSTTHASPASSNIFIVLLGLFLFLFSATSDRTRQILLRLCFVRRNSAELAHKALHSKHCGGVRKPNSLADLNVLHLRALKEHLHLLSEPTDVNSLTDFYIGIPRPFKANTETIPYIRYDRFLPCPIQFMIYYHPFVRLQHLNYQQLCQLLTRMSSRIVYIHPVPRSKHTQSRLYKPVS